MGNPKKDSDGATGDSITTPQDAHQAASDLNQER